MNKQLTRLIQIAKKEERIIIGLMSGTSLDGLDVALCKISASGADVKINLMEFETLEYDQKLRGKIKSIQSMETIDSRLLTILHTELGIIYGQNILILLNKWGLKAHEIDLIASHGQTIFHAPSEDQTLPHCTLQIADGDHIAEQCGVITISDFRQKHTAVGGEGAPLAGIFDEALFRSESQNRVLLNLGGIGNITWLPSKNKNGDCISSDTGPANTLINEAMHKYFQKAFDEGGRIAREGTVHSELLKYILLEPFFRKSLPKTTGQEDFSLAYIEALMEGHGMVINPKDLIATLTAVTVHSITRMLDEVAKEASYEIFVSGGGVHNMAIMDGLKERLPNAVFREFGDFGFSPDAKEAVMMAFFANELVSGEGFIIPGVTEEKVQLGKISLPG